ncbi:outer membrane beta-barrel protein [Aliihoeflea aestuarii]|uniref:outer membrane beta-barrel protein n=1 Tax=Aliihoeflea aestuarii TaxID=453840 RepID=UPI0020962BB9|nr:outer membrane beta-barrel protein [Aliihoeflea aestuarii]MCO6393348.1 outer membrane beta-barrel protein [Aliihoeflea aestuarii]
MANQTFRLGKLARRGAYALAIASVALGSHGVLAQEQALPLRGSLQDEPITVVQPLDEEAVALPADAEPELDETTTGTVRDRTNDARDERTLRGTPLRTPLTERDSRAEEPVEAPADYRPFSEGAISTGEPLADSRPDPTPVDLFSDDDPFAGSDPLGPQSREGRVQPLGRLVPATQRAETDVLLDGTTTATVPLAAIDAEDLQRNLRVGTDAERINSIETTRRGSPDDPFAPVGLRLGTFELFPSIEQGIGWTSNADGGVEGDEAFYSETTGRFDLRSDWSRHEARLNGFGILRRDIAGAEIRDVEAGLDGELRFDFSDGYEGRAAFGYLHRPESATAPDTVEGAVSRPDRDTLSGELGIAREIARLRLGLTAAATRDTFSDAELPDGTIISQKDRNSTLAVLRLRTGYEVSPALIPFAEIEAGRRIYDNEIDAAGFRRSADRMALRGGIAIDIAEKWRGEAFAGWLWETPDDEAFERVSGLELGGTLAWSPVRGTIVDLNALTSVEGATAPGAGGSLLYAANLSVTRELRANLTGTAGIGLDYRDYANSSAHDLTWSGQLALTWWFNRYLGLTGRARYENFTSSVDGRDSDTASVFVGLRAQR